MQNVNPPPPTILQIFIFYYIYIYPNKSRPVRCWSRHRASCDWRSDPQVLRGPPRRRSPRAVRWVTWSWCRRACPPACPIWTRSHGSKWRRGLGRHRCDPRYTRTSVLTSMTSSVSLYTRHELQLQSCSERHFELYTVSWFHHHLTHWTTFTTTVKLQVWFNLKTLWQK